jgi:hypothetical protein
LSLSLTFSLSLSRLVSFRPNKIWYRTYYMIWYMIYYMPIINYLKGDYAHTSVIKVDVISWFKIFSPKQSAPNSMIY